MELVNLMNAFLWIAALSTGCHAASTRSDRGELSNYFSSSIDPVISGLRESRQQNLSSPCLKQVNLLISGAESHQPWALNLIDSIGKPSDKLSAGSVTYLGQYSQCLGAGKGSLRGKYCLASVTLDETAKSQIGAVSGLSSSSVDSITPKVGVCGPSTCSLEEMRKIVSAVIASFLPNSTATLSTCYQENNDFRQDVGAHMFLAFLGIFASLILVGTLYEYISSPICASNPLAKCRGFRLWKTENSCNLSNTSLNSAGTSNSDVPLTSGSPVHQSDSSSCISKFWLAFSLRSNSSKILSIADDASIGSFHGMRVLSMLWIIYGHSSSFAMQWLFFEGNPSPNPTNLFSQLVGNSTFAVDTFFYLSGFLAAYTMLKDMDKSSGSLSILKIYIHRYARIAPVMMIIIGFSVTLLRYLGEGPAWDNSTMMFDSWCQKNWWINALFLHNFIDRGNMCLSHSWYLAVDFQLYLIAPLFIYPMYKRVKWGFSLLAGFLLIGIVSTLVLTLYYGFPAVPYVNDVITTDKLNLYFGLIYIKPYARMGPFLVGIAAGYLFTVMKRQDSFASFLRPLTAVFGWMLTLIGLFAILAAMIPVFRGVILPPVFEAVYSSFSRPLWAVCLAWMTLACVSGKGGPINDILCWSGWRPLSRLNYTVYLVHPIVMAVFYGSQQVTFQFSTTLMTYFLIGNIFMSYCVAFLVSLCFELPIGQLERHFLFSSRK